MDCEVNKVEGAHRALGFVSVVFAGDVFFDTADCGAVYAESE